ncbi:aspartyl/asparaginyl beta-hydroxylase isoform X9 [Poecilia latipinna]|uniref:aspartyl/asparaginyl beta-hydroxylase isoform X9 n=1 Tax=Poecilia latipinna TaxID=48699 RepID=UPI00072E3AE4|nr:PREDICTED: aspartyl/asparaginyl beta-hydroxylase isoform X9 [Poecilia latipinna]
MGDPANLVESITPPVVTAIPAGEMQDAGKSLLSSKNGKKPDSGSSSSSSSFFTWFIVLALLGVWTSVAVVYFDLVDYQGVLDKAKGIQINLSETLQGKLAAYDTDGDGDFDVEDAKVLLGLTSLGCGQGEAQVLDWLEEVEEGGSDWLNSFFTFLYTVINPLEPLEDEEDHGTSGVMNGQKENEEEEDEEEVRQRGAKDDGNKGQKIIIVGLHNQ